MEIKQVDEKKAAEIEKAASKDQAWVLAHSDASVAWPSLETRVFVYRRLRHVVKAVAGVQKEIVAAITRLEGRLDRLELGRAEKEFAVDDLEGRLVELEEYLGEEEGHAVRKVG